MEAERSMVEVGCHGVAATKSHGRVVRPSQLIASVMRTEGDRKVGGGIMRMCCHGVFTVLVALLACAALQAGDWTTIRPAVTTEAELLAAFGSPDEVVATFPWAEWSARWKKRPVAAGYVLSYQVQGSKSPLLVGPAGQADHVEVNVWQGKVGAVRWQYGGPTARAAAEVLRGDPQVRFDTADTLAHGGKPVTGGLLSVEIGPRDARVEVLLQLK